MVLYVKVSGASLTCSLCFGPPPLNTVTGLEETWQNLKLTTDEEQVIVANKDDGSSTNELISLCLLGHLHTTNSFNLRLMIQKTSISSSSFPFYVFLLL